MGDGEDPGRRRTVPAGERSIQMIVDRRIRAILEKRLPPIEARIAELADGRPAGGAPAGEGVDQPEGLESVTEEVARIAEVLDRLVAQHDRAPAPFHWDDLEPDEREKRWVAFTEWVDTVLRPWLPRHTKALRSCWEDHPGVVYLLTAAWFAWGAAARGDGRKGPEMLAWMKDMRSLHDDLVAELGNPNVPCNDHKTTPTPRRP